jgi:hypothetical protein
MLLFVLAISATESWMYVTDFVYHKGVAQYDTRIPPSTQRRPRRPTVALDSPPSCLYLVDSVLAPPSSYSLEKGQRKKENRKVTWSRRPFTNRDDSIAS